MRRGCESQDRSYSTRGGRKQVGQEGGGSQIVWSRVSGGVLQGYGGVSMGRAVFLGVFGEQFEGMCQLVDL